LTKCVENRLPAYGLAIQVYMRVCGYRPWSVKDGTGVQHDVGVNTSTSLDLLQCVWSFRCNSRKIFDLANQTGQTEIGAHGKISTSIETFTQKLGHARF
jgi:hypothetical protein